MYYFLCIVDLLREQIKLKAINQSGTTGSILLRKNNSDREDIIACPTKKANGSLKPKHEANKSKGNKITKKN